jgi:hypothetical protein
MSRYYAPNLQAIAEAIGTTAALQLAQARGGTIVYIPTNPSVVHWLSRLLGQENALKIAILFGGRSISIPLGPFGGQHSHLHRAISAGLAAGQPAATIARATGTHERTVRRHRSRQRDAAAHDPQNPQGKLF